MKKLALALLLTVSTAASAMTREALAKVKVEADGQFTYWTENCAVLQTLKTYISEITDETGSKFVPKANRIAVFDMDGTLISETTPFYTGWLLWQYRVESAPESVSAENLVFAKVMKDSIYNHIDIKGDYEWIQAHYQNEGFKGMTPEEYNTYLRNWMDNTPATGMSHMMIGEAIYVPMLEIVSYLLANDFHVYVVSGADRGLVRATAEGVINIPRSQCIGSDIKVVGSMQGEKDSRVYTMQAGERMERGDVTTVDVKFNKIQNIIEEIGQQPILAFGNSSGDFSMFRYTTQDNPYPAAAFCLLCDDTTRDYGNPTKAASTKSTCENNGWYTVSMRDDWKTIYGYDVTKDVPVAVDDLPRRNTP